MEARELREINSDILRRVYITGEEVREVLKCVKVDESLGSDQAFPRTLWEARETIAGPLAEIFASSTATEVTKMIDEGKVVDVVYMNYSKVFDKVPHSRLVNK
eukprot:g36058.t1